MNGSVFNATIGLSSSDSNGLCENTVQGIMLVTDNRGRSCQRSALDPQGCCPSQNSTSFSCDSCRIAQQCCATYEYCVSCCMRPENVRFRTFAASGSSLISSTASWAALRVTVHANLIFSMHYNRCLQYLDTATSPGADDGARKEREAVAPLATLPATTFHRVWRYL